MDLSTIKNNYSNLSNKQLVELIDKPKILRPEVIDLLKSELTLRGLTEELAILNENIEFEAFQNELIENPDKAREYVQTRLKNGHSIEEIRLDLKELGLNVFELLSDEIIEVESKNYIYQELKDEGLNQVQIEEVLETEFNYSTEEQQQLKEIIRKRGRLYVTLGVFMAIIGLLLFVSSIAMGRLRGSFILVFGFGIERIVKGQKLLQSLR